MIRSELGNIVETALQAGNLNTLAAALEASDLISVLADESQTYTVFAPTDDAFAKLGEDTVNDLLADPDKLRDILLYHVVPGTAVDAATALSLAGTTVTTANDDDIAVSLGDGKLFVNMSEVIATDIVASNGIIHLIDSVLIPPADTDDEAILGSIVETAAAAGSFNTLVTALQATGLDAVLANTEETFTVFAPTDDAFAKLGDDTINALLADPDALSSILLYHVIGDQAIDSTTAISLAGNSVATVNGAAVSISLDGSRLLINDSAVIAPDVAASNGIIHGIDTVLLPPNDDTLMAMKVRAEMVAAKRARFSISHVTTLTSVHWLRPSKPRVLTVPSVIRTIFILFLHRPTQLLQHSVKKLSMLCLQIPKPCGTFCCTTSSQEPFSMLMQRSHWLAHPFKPATDRDLPCVSTVQIYWSTTARSLQPIYSVSMA